MKVALKMLVAILAASLCLSGLSYQYSVTSQSMVKSTNPLNYIPSDSRLVGTGTMQNVSVILFAVGSSSAMIIYGTPDQIKETKLARIFSGGIDLKEPVQCYNVPILSLKSNLSLFLGGFINLIFVSGLQPTVFLNSTVYMANPQSNIIIVGTLPAVVSSIRSGHEITGNALKGLELNGKKLFTFYEEGSGVSGIERIYGNLTASKFMADFYFQKNVNAFDYFVIISNILPAGTIILPVGTSGLSITSSTHTLFFNLIRVYLYILMKAVIG